MGDGEGRTANIRGRTGCCHCGQWGSILLDTSEVPQDCPSEGGGAVPSPQLPSPGGGVPLGRELPYFLVAAAGEPSCFCTFGEDPRQKRGQCPGLSLSWDVACMRGTVCGTVCGTGTWTRVAQGNVMWAHGLSVGISAKAGNSQSRITWALKPDCVGSDSRATPRCWGGSFASTSLSFLDCTTGTTTPVPQSWSECWLDKTQEALSGHGRRGSFQQEF